MDLDAVMDAARADPELNDADECQSAENAG